MQTKGYILSSGTFQALDARLVQIKQSDALPEEAPSFVVFDFEQGATCDDVFALRQKEAYYYCAFYAWGHDAIPDACHMLLEGPLD
jgi:hypothetical protein